MRYLVLLTLLAGCPEPTGEALPAEGQWSLTHTYSTEGTHLPCGLTRASYAFRLTSDGEHYTMLDGGDVDDLVVTCDAGACEVFAETRKGNDRLWLEYTMHPDRRVTGTGWLNRYEGERVVCFQPFTVTGEVR